MFRKKRVLVTGGQSMIGRCICDELQKMEAYVDPVPHSECDLLDIDQVRERFELFEPDIVMNLASWNGGIEWNIKHPAKIFYRTLQIGLNVNGIAADKRVDHIINILASCAYPDQGHEILEESNFWNGMPNSTVEGHGLAKRSLHAFARQITKEFQIPTTSLILTNAFGPFDSFHPSKTKVIGALIRKFVEAKIMGKNKVIAWGSGSPLREFIYSRDAGRAITASVVHSNELFKKSGPQSLLFNIGSGQEVSIRELTEVIAELVGYKGEVVWDTSKQDGQHRKLLKSKQYVEMTPLRQALKETIEWYKENKEYADNKEIK